MFSKLLYVLFVAIVVNASASEIKDTDQKCDDSNTTSCIVVERPKVICYFTNWSPHRDGKAQYRVTDIDTNLCTHIIYSFATLNRKTLVMQMDNPKIDTDLYKQVTSLKSKGLKVLIALGGWLDSGDSDKYSRMINHGSSRSNFVHQAVGFLKRHNFDGLDLDWEYPKCWQGNCTAGPVSDKRNFGNLVKELRKAFSHNSFLLSVAVSASKTVSNKAYSFADFSENVDWIGIMTYDFYTESYHKTVHHSPLMGTIDSIQFWLDQGVPASKLVMGIPLYGRSFTLADESIHGVGAPSTIGQPGEYTKENGFLAYFEFCTGWDNRTDSGVGSNYAFKGDQWVSYNDISMIQLKAGFIKQSKLAGAMVWALDTDDYSGFFCNQGKYPLLNALRNAL